MIFHILTFGCQMNDLDTELLEGLLLQYGFSPGNLEEADAVILFTCCVRETAENRALGHVSRLKKWKEERPDRSLIFAGCLAQKEGEKLGKRFPYIDYVIGPGNIFELPELLKNRLKKGTFVDHLNKRDKGPVITYRRNSFRASVNISYGCNNYCSYCIVPYVRGELVHRPVEDILREISSLLGNGMKEITLLGQNVNAYSYKGVTFPRLLRIIAQTDGLERLRFVTSHPKDFSEEIIRVMAEETVICESLHLPMQSGSNRILQNMGRNYTVEEYIKTVNILRREIPGIALSSDFITGFPGESPEDFNDTLQAIQEIRFDTAFLFLYNSRPLTRAASMEGQLPYNIKQERLEKMIKAQQQISFEINKTYIGKKISVLVTHPSPRYSHQVVGRSRTDKNVVFEGTKDLIGQFVKVKVQEAYPATLIGEIYAYEKVIRS